jgi:O-methyltransferase involved in polyketide biosynthesis
VGDEDIQHTSESALLTAGWRAMESSRPDALFPRSARRGPARRARLTNRQTLPSWEAFFTQHGWRIKEIRFLGEESERLHRPVPLSRFDKVMRLFTSRPLRDMGYASIERIH